jgi:predicted metalloprotease with PDZ domain
MDDAISYTLRFPDAQSHRVEVEASFPAGGAEAVELMMAVWTPGSYLVREFARNVETLSAESVDGAPLAVEKTRKNRWRVASGGAERVVVRYRLYCREMSVRTNFVDAGFAILNGAPTFVTQVDGEAPATGPYRVALELPEGWETAVSALEQKDGAFVAGDFDTLVDSPIYAGSPVVDRFAVGRGAVGGEAEVVLVHEGGGEVWDHGRAGRDVEAIVETQAALWGEVPFDRYVILNLVTEAGGGLEHKGSTVLMTSRWKARTEDGWRGWLGLVSHELFHAWNGKRLRPAALGPFDYEREVYTPSLWFVEGVTSYYDDLLVHRAGLSTREQYLERLGETVEAVQTTPGRLVQPLEDASFDAWIKFYRRDENTVNSGVSYYRKGALVAWLLDARLRRASAGAASLDDLLRAAWRRWSGARGYTAAELLALVAELGGEDTAAWLEAALSDAAELDYAPALEWLGLELAEKEEAPGKPEPAEGRRADDDEPAAWLGAAVEVRDGRLRVTEVRRGTPAFAAGVNVDDELVAVDDYRLPADGLDERLKSYRPGDEVTLLVARRERLLRLPLTFGEEPEKLWYPRPAPAATPDQELHRNAWLGG